MGFYFARTKELCSNPTALGARVERLGKLHIIRFVLEGGQITAITLLLYTKRKSSKGQMMRDGRARTLAQRVRSVAKLVVWSPSSKRPMEPVAKNSAAPIMVTIPQEHYQTLLNRVDILTKIISDLRDKVDDVHSQPTVSKANRQSPVLET